MATITNATLNLAHDHERKTVRAVQFKLNVLTVGLSRTAAVWERIARRRRVCGPVTF